MVEGKNALSKCDDPEYNDKGPIVRLLMRLCRMLFNTGKAVVLDSGFRVLEGLIKVRKWASLLFQ